MVGWWPSCGMGEHKGRWPESPADPSPVGMGQGCAPPTGAGLLLTCFFSAHSPHHRWHCGHCRPVHPVVLWRLLHVSFYCKPQDGAGQGGGVGIAWGRARGLGVEMPLPLGSQHFTVFRVLLTSLGPLESGWAQLQFWKPRLISEMTCLVPGEGLGGVSTPQGSSMYPLLSAVPLAGPGLSRSELGPSVPSHPATSYSRPSGSQGRHGGGRAEDRQPSGRNCGIPPGSPTVWPPAAAAQLYSSSAKRVTVAPQADLGYALTAESVWQVCLSACWSTPEGRGKRAPLWRDGESPTYSGVHPRGRTQG